MELQVTVAGARIYATGRRGIACINLHTGGEIFKSPWPEVVSRFFLPSEVDGEENKIVASGASNQWQGRIPHATGAEAQANPFQQINTWSSFSSSRHSPYPVQQVAKPTLPGCFPINNAVADGKLYALVAPHQLVALSHTQNGTKKNPTNTDNAIERPD